MKNKLFFSLIIFSFILIHSCKTVKIDKPTETYVPPVYKPEVSTIALPINVNMTELEKSINKQFFGLIFEDLTDESLQLKVWKTKDFRVRVENNQIIYTIPVRVWSKFGWKVNKFGFTISDYYEVTGELSISLSTSLSISPTWDLRTTTRIEKHSWTKRPVLRAMGINIPIGLITDAAIAGTSKILSSVIVESITEIADVKGIMTETWESFQEPMLVSEEHSTWVAIKPVEASCSPLKTENNNMMFTVGVKAFIDCIIGDKPAKIDVPKLPNLKLVKSIDKDFLVNFNVDVSSSFIRKTLKEELVGEKFSQGRRYILINDIDFFGHDGKMIFKISVEGSLKGTLYFTGKPIYIPETETVEIVESNFELNTRNVLLKSADWLLHGTILRKLEPHLKFSVKEFVDPMLEDLNKELENYVIEEGIIIKGKIDNVEVENIFIMPLSVQLNGKVKGNAELHIEGF